MPDRDNIEELLHPTLIDLLESFADVFQKPQELPPPRPRGHATHLAASAEPVNVKPYQYPYFQKQVMEQMGTEML